MKNVKKKISLLVSTSLLFTTIFSVSSFNVNQFNTGSTVYAATLSHMQTAHEASKNVKVTSITLNKTSDTLTVGNKDFLCATVSPVNAKNKEVSWTSSNSGIVTVRNGEIKAISAGTATITATSRDGNYSASCLVTVNPIVTVTSVSLDKTSDTLAVGTKDTLNAAVLPSNATNTRVKWTSSNRKVAQVENGVVIALSAGTAIITVTSDDGKFAASCNVTVTPKVKVTSITIDKTSDTIAAGNTDTLNATIAPTNATDKGLRWASTNRKVAQVEKGVVTGISAGTAIITVTSEDGRCAASCTVTVTPRIKVTSITLDKTSDTIAAGKTDTLNAAIAPINATNKDLRWITTNKRIAQVNNGVVTAISAGTAIIIVTSEDGRCAASCTVTVTTPVTSVALNKTTDSLVVGNTDKLTAAVSPINATNTAVMWTTSDSTVATVTDGTVTAVAAGTATITATTLDGNYTATCTVTVTNPVTAVTSVSLDKTTDSLVVGSTDKLTATVSPTNATNTAVTWTTSDPTVVTVASDGTITAVGPGTATIYVTTADGSYTASCTITVTTP